MLGSNIGTLSVEALLSGVWTTLWAASGDQGSAWLDAAVFVAPTATQLRFLGRTGSGWRSDFAIDALEVQMQLGCLSFQLLDQGTKS